MTMGIEGGEIESMPEGEAKHREIRLRYSGALVVMVENELRLAAARLIATYPLVTEEEFLRRASEAFRSTTRDVHIEACVAKTAVPVRLSEE